MFKLVNKFDHIMTRDRAYVVSAKWLYYTLTVLLFWFRGFWAGVAFAVVGVIFMTAYWFRAAAAEVRQDDEDLVRRRNKD